MLGVAKGTTQVATTETHEYGRHTTVIALALQRVEYFVDLIHGHETERPVVSRLAVPRQLIKVLRRVVLDVRGLVVARLPHIGAVAVRNSVDNPFGQVLSSGIEVQHVVDVGMVDLAVDHFFDQGKVAHHAIAVKLLGAAIHIDLPVMAMQVLTLAFVIEI